MDGNDLKYERKIQMNREEIDKLNDKIIKLQKK